MRPFRVLPALMLVLLFYSSPARAAVITVESLTVNPGDAFSLGIMVTDVTDLTSFNFDIAFDPTVLAVSGTRLGPLFQADDRSTFFIPGAIPGDPNPYDDGDPETTDDELVSPGFVLFTGGTIVDPSEGVDVPAGAMGVPVLAFLDFTVIGSGNTTVALSNVLLVDQGGGVIPTDIINGTVTVDDGSSQPVPEPSTLALLGVGLAVVARKRLKRKSHVH